MLIKQKFLDGIAEGRISLAFRRWKRPTVKAGGSLRTIIGVLAIEAVDVVTDKSITKHPGKRAVELAESAAMGKNRLRPTCENSRNSV